MDGTEWLRTQLTSFGCAACGFAYGAEGIAVAAERDGLYFVDLSCGMCGSAATAIVTVALDDDAGPTLADPELTPAASRPWSPDPIGVDDLLDVHRLLDSWDGDLVGLLRRLDGVEGTVAR